MCLTAEMFRVLSVGILHFYVTLTIEIDSVHYYFYELCVNAPSGDAMYDVNTSVELSGYH